MTTFDEYHHYASECARWAAQEADQRDRDVLLDMAHAWMRVAMVERDVTRQSAAEQEATPPLGS